MKSEIKLGFVDYTALVFIPDPASTDGSGKTGLVAANLTVSYTRVETDNDVTVTDVTSSLNNLAALTTAHTDWGLLEVSSTLAPGLYRLDIADAVFASGAWTAVVYVMITTSAAAASPMEFILVAFDPLDTVRLGLTALPNAAAEAAGGLYTRGTGAGQINQAANGQVDANSVALSGDATAADNAEAFFDGTGYAGTNNVIPTVTTTTTATNVTTVNGLAAAVITAASIATDAITAAKIATDAIGAAELAADAVAEIADQVWDEVLAGHLTAGSTGNALNAAGAAGDPWSTALPGAYGAGTAGKIVGDNVNATISSRASQASVDTIDDFLDTEVAAIKAKTDSLTFTTALQVDANTLAIDSSASAATHLKDHSLTAVPVTFAAGGTTTTAVLVNVDGAAASSTDDFYNGRVLIFTAPSGLKYQATDITDYVGATKTATITAVTAAPVATATAIMV